ncbi:MAG: hypothetical protein Q8P41_13825, partial [Pseudomonadota bacterium]|nr:hypothetical protein [Pseudomonadota bacterium]
MPGPSSPWPRRMPWAWLCAATLLVLAPATFGAPSAPGSTPPGKAASAKAPAEPAAIVLSAATVPAVGARHVQLEVARFGRYALSATSAQGTAVQLVDRMAGPGEVVGAPGSRNGRLDAFLERGEYRLRVLSDLAGTGEARVEARPFVEVNGARLVGSENPPMLPDIVTQATTLADLEQRSWWVNLDADQAFAVELAGRSLADVRLWRDGQWLDPAAPTCEDVSADPARPLRRCALHASLAAGLWQLTAYGGPAVPWTVPDGDQPLYVRRGVPTLAEAGRLSEVIGPFGAERWLVPPETTNFRLELPGPGTPGGEGGTARIAVRTFEQGNPFRRDGDGRSITKETMPPLAEVSVGGSREGRVVTVSGAVGQPFVLQHFPGTGRFLSVRGDGTYFLTTLHGGDPADLPDVTGVLVEAPRKDAPPMPPVVASLLPLTPEGGYRRKFNLLVDTTLAFEVSAAAEYHVAVSVPGVGWRWEPMITSTPAGYAPPPYREGPGATALTPGRWRLTLAPKTPGIAEVAIRRDPMARLEPTAPRPNVQLAAVTLDRTKVYELRLAQGAGGAKVGMVLRALPADLSQPLPLTLGPGESVTVPSVARDAGTITAGAGLEVAVDGAGWAAQANVGIGGHTVLVRNPGTAVVQGAVALLAHDRRPGAPLPELPDTISTTPPDLPVLAASARSAPEGGRTLDLGANDDATYRLRVDEAGLFRVESTGLLATAGAVRTRTNPVLEAAAVNGVGRNFLLQRYLREGDYQVTVATQGSSAGHLGLRLTPTTLRDGGALRDRVPARATVPAGEGIAYRYDVAEAGEYVLRSFGQGVGGQGRLFRVRVEDADGWPLVAPDVDGDLRLDLPAGSGRIVVLPEPVETTRITTFERVPEPVVRLGHGPHALALDDPATHVWWEPTSGEDRAPDVWTFALRAPADVTIAATAEMAGDLVRDGALEPVARLVPGRAWTGRLDAGTYRLELVNTRRNSGVTYSVRVTPRELVPGLSRAVAAPAAVPVSVGADGLVELTSMGVSDVRARLYDSAGRLVVAADDRPDDWNFRIAERLAPGAYTLQIDPVGAAQGTTTVTMALSAEADAPPLAAGSSRTMTPSSGAGVARVPLQVPTGPAGEGGLLVVSARSTENVGLAVEAQDEGAWTTIGRATGPAARVLVRLGAEGRHYRLRVESLDGRGVAMTVRVDLVTPKSLAEGALSAGATVPVDKATGLAAAVVTRQRPGTLELAARVGLSWCPTPGESCVEVPGALLAAPDPAVWLVAEAPAGRPVAMRGSRYVLGSAPGRVLVPADGEVAVDVAPSAGPLLVRAAASGGQPGLRVAEGGAAGTASGTAVAPGRAIGVLLAGKAPVARLLGATAGEGA